MWRWMRWWVGQWMRRWMRRSAGSIGTLTSKLLLLKEEQLRQVPPPPGAPANVPYPAPPFHLSLLPSLQYLLSLPPPSYILLSSEYRGLQSNLNLSQSNFSPSDKVAIWQNNILQNSNYVWLFYSLMDYMEYMQYILWIGGTDRERERGHEGERERIGRLGKVWHDFNMQTNDEITTFSAFSCHARNTRLHTLCVCEGTPRACTHTTNTNTNMHTHTRMHMHMHMHM